MYSDPLVSDNNNKTDTNAGSYVAHVLDPEHTPATRIPSEFPIKTALQQIDRVDIVPTDANGNLLFRATFPDLSTNTVANGATINNDGTWSPITDDDGLTAITSLNPGAAAYTSDARYRIVAYKVKLRYIGAELTRSGVFFGAHDFSTNYAHVLQASSIRQLQDGPYFEMHPTDEGIEVIYKPYDNSYLEFGPKILFRPDVAGSSVWYAPYTIYAGLIGGQASSNVVLIQQYLTIEWIPGRSQNDLVGTQECIGSPSNVALIDGSDIVRKADEIPRKNQGLLSKTVDFIGNLGKNDLFKSLGNGIINTLSILPPTAPLMFGGKLLTNMLINNPVKLANMVKM